jgi:hypothetical protein
VAFGLRLPLKGLSCMMGNYHVQFLGGKEAVKPLTYPVPAINLNNEIDSLPPEEKQKERIAYDKTSILFRFN